MTDKPQCEVIANAYRKEIEDIVNTQVNEGREAIFFMYEDGSTSGVFKGENTRISLSREEEQRVMRQGNIAGSVHTHPTGLDLSTIDIMTGLLTSQESMCVATPLRRTASKDDFALTCLNLSNLSRGERKRMVRAMRRSSVGITEIGREIRKQTSLSRFSVTGCRTHETETEGIELPITDRPSRFNIEIGPKRVTRDIDGDVALYENDSS
jgi:proteasome lid subunit RPN8/RPN11